jgi:transcriptional regulator with PAS, ATPase and Fis domain
MQPIPPAPDGALDPFDALTSLVGPSAVARALGDLVPNAAVYAVNRERDIVFWSRGATKLLGFTEEESIGHHCLKSSRCLHCLKGCPLSERGNIDGAPIEVHHASGAPVAVRKYARAFYAPNGDFLGGVEVLVADTGASTSAPAGLPRGKVLDFHGLITRDLAMRRALEIVQNVSHSDVPVLIRGESGTGKELIARGIHLESHRAAKPFVAVNCAAMPEALLESELFGHVRGAFTGAVRDRDGVFAQANGGTLFLDEVAEIPLHVQAKLLRVLQEQNFVPVGGSRPVQVDVRIVSATHRSLRKLVEQGSFREDLMYRLRVVPLFLPPLRERRDDVALLLDVFIAQRNKSPRSTRQILHIEPDAMRCLLDHPWPGNVRELKNVVEYAFAVGRGEALRLQDLPPEFRETEAPPSERGLPPSPSSAPPPPVLDERAAIEDALRRSGGKVSRAAELLGMSRATFWRKRQRYLELDPTRP